MITFPHGSMTAWLASGPSGAWWASVFLLVCCTMARVTHACLNVSKSLLDARARAEGWSSAHTQVLRSDIGATREPLFMLECLFYVVAALGNPLAWTRVGGTIVWGVVAGFAWRAERAGHPVGQRAAAFLFPSCELVCFFLDLSVLWTVIRLKGV